MSNDIHFSEGHDSILIATIDMADRSVNVVNEAFLILMKRLLDHINNRCADDTNPLHGVIITSGKKTFVAGADLDMVAALKKGDEEKLFLYVETFKNLLRRLEMAPVPIIAALNGAALGGGYELALACHHRIGLDRPDFVVGFPEVRLGLIPGGGGIIRLTRLFGIAKALPLLSEGRRYRATDALKLGLIDAIAATPEALLADAKAWLSAHPKAKQPWDRSDYRIPGDNPRNPRSYQLLAIAPAMLYKRSRGVYSAPEKILETAIEGAYVDFDTATRIESRKFVQLAFSTQAQAMIASLFFGLNAIKAGQFRPPAITPRRFSHIGLVGAGMMGAGIAYVTAHQGLNVTIVDLDQERAQNAKIHAQQITDKRVRKKRMTPDQQQALLDRIQPTTDITALAECDIVIEAVYEKSSLKAAIIRDCEAVLSPTAVMASNTSTLPITQLATASARPESFIGLHFFSPVEKMMLVEIIPGAATDAATIAAGFDLARQLGKTPIIVGDSPGFFTSRVFASYIDEGMAMLCEGLDPEIIDHNAELAGMPIGPMAAADEVSEKLIYDISEAHRTQGEAGLSIDRAASDRVVHFLVVESKRLGKAYGGGIYDRGKGGGKTVWPKLRERFGCGSKILSHDEIRDRLLFRQVLEAQRCRDEGIVRNAIEGDIGSIMGIGFPAATGGVFRYLDDYGHADFIARANLLAATHGDRFAPPSSLRAGI